MHETITLELPENVLTQARQQAKRTNRSVEEVIAEWLSTFTDEAPLETMDDAQLLNVAHGQMSDEDQRSLSDLLELNREGQLTNEQTHKLDDLMQTYRRGLVRKAQAWKLAVERGLLPPINQ